MSWDAGLGVRGVMSAASFSHAVFDYVVHSLNAPEYRGKRRRFGIVTISPRELLYNFNKDTLHYFLFIKIKN